MCAIIEVQILLYKYCYMQCNVLFSHIKNCVLKIISDALFEFKSKDKYERKMLNRLKRNFKRKIYINSFCLMSQVLFFFDAGRWTNGKRMKQNKLFKNVTLQNFADMMIWDVKAKLVPLPREQRERRWINCGTYIIDLTSCSTYRHFSSMCKWYLLFLNDNFVEK